MGTSPGLVSDTAPDARQIVVERWRSMPPGEKFAIVDELNRACEQLSAAGVRRRFPHADDDEVRQRVLALRLGRDLMVAAYGWDPSERGW